MNRISTNVSMRFIALGILLSAASLCFAERPNVLLFLVDDMGLMDTSVSFLTDSKGQPQRYPLNDFYRTPNMQRLADQGIRFSNFYAMSVCSPTRISIMTGLTSAGHHTTAWIKPESNNAGPFGAQNWQWEGVTPKHVMLPALLRQAGYRTIHCGKGHFGPNGTFGAEPKNFGFDVNIAGCAYGAPGRYYGKQNFARGNKGRVNREVPGLDKYHGKDIYLTEALTLEINAQIENAVKAKQPFFAYMSHYAVHAPFQADPRFVGNYPQSKKPLAAFASMIEGMDKSLGDILDHLERLGVAENTLVFFLGDNGTDAPNGPTHSIACAAPLRGKKGTHYEGGMRVPFIAAWAKPNLDNPFQKRTPIAKGAIINNLVAVYDLFPTILSLTGSTPPPKTTSDGRDLLPLLSGKSKTAAEREFLMHFPHAHRSSYFTSYRKGNWKLVYHYRWTPKNPWKQTELFDLSKDRDESHNLASTHPKKLKTMMESMIASLDRSSAQYPLADDKITHLKPILKRAN